ncbi:predicted protein [Uncinocarpus reesii 1704]|uniref:Uncharacterized protein n=1 Tax=Uncinocarpus reesii (strain UAMH 1704) TaxID=336963 RepID=C4JDX3_UNCRE|nr:uncharacterized protein UREG_00596 [Uncinocarpus reesii 1704]EEP75749.1 predicted protein [Uncinocarpus reesii 1704]
MARGWDRPTGVTSAAPLRLPLFAHSQSRFDPLNPMGLRAFSGSCDSSLWMEVRFTVPNSISSLGTLEPPFQFRFLKDEWSSAGWLLLRPLDGDSSRKYIVSRSL